MSSQPHATTPVAAAGWRSAPGGEGLTAVATRVRMTSARGFLTATATLAVALLLCVPIGAAAQVVLASQLDDRTPTQAMVVLDPVRNWGTAGPVVKARALHAAQLYREGVAPVVFLPGTQRSTDRARQVLIEAGVPDEDIVALASGADTVGSLRAVGEVMRGLGWSAATVVTDPAHAARTQATAGVLGLDAHVSPTEAGSGTALTSEYVGREVIALLRFHLLSRWTLPTVIPATPH